MTEQHGYTPLQSLLLFQALAASSSSSALFDDIASQLRQSAVFTSGTAADDQRFTPESLKNLYLGLAKEETRRDINGQRSSPTRRKSPTPKQPPKHDDQQYGRNAAELVPRLYDEYRAQVIREIQDNERKYESLSGKLKSLRAGPANGRLADDNALNTGNGHYGAESPDVNEGNATPQRVSVDPFGNDQQRAQTSAKQMQPAGARPSPSQIAQGKTPILASQSPNSAQQTPVPQAGVPPRVGHLSGTSTPREQHSASPNPDPFAVPGSAMPQRYPSQPQLQQAGSAKHKGGMMLTPFQVSPQPEMSRHSPAGYPVKMESRQTGTPQQASSLAATRPIPGPLQLGPQHHFTNTSSHVPVPGSAHLRKPDVVQSPGSSTAWKVISDVPVLERPAPGERSVSPLSEPDEAETPMPSGGSARGRGGRRGRGTRGNQTPASARGGRRSAPQRTESPSARSQSMSSQVEEGSRAPSRLRAKVEVPDTPGVPSVSGDETLTRRTSSRRKRALSPTDTEKSVDEDGPLDAGAAEAGASQQMAPAVVTGTRNFSRVAAALLNTIASHKYASLFSDPVTNKQVDGYEDIVKNRQDLKSIRAAIKNGERAVNAAAAVEASPGGGSISSSVTLPMSDAVMPPKGIVNAAQLEGEIYRMFANAVMFNTGEDDYVQEAREMFQDTEREIQSWRSTEGEQDAASAAGEDDVGASSKRRRI